MLFKRFFLVFISVCFLASWVFPWIVSAATELHVAAQQGNVGKVKRLLKQEIDVNSLSSSGYTPLHISAGFDKRRVTKLLLINGGQKLMLVTHQVGPPFTLARVVVILRW